MPDPESQPAIQHVSPVYLAGTAPSVHALRPLQEAGFRQEIDRAGNVRLTSPRGGHHVDYLPNGLTHALWCIYEAPDRYTPPSWLAEFTTGTPPEVVEALTTALAKDVHRARSQRRRPQADRVLRPLAEAGWHRRENEWEIEFIAPDQLAEVRYDTTPGHPLDPDYQPWLIHGGRTHDNGYMDWYGAFTTHAPTRLVTATVERLANTNPVDRAADAVLHPKATVTTTATRSTAPRAAAARSRTSAGCSSPGTPESPSPASAQTTGHPTPSRPRLRR
ncbi:DUF317 domain-containing protein [Streptomyces sp. NPDC048172]|uniref:DUF317 domain-containing protein n=1 Tax=Streptomyces sp. NPDC048172 TaxID=3365505 RepID=UPI0037222371